MTPLHWNYLNICTCLSCWQHLYISESTSACPARKKRWGKLMFVCLWCGCCFSWWRLQICSCRSVGDEGREDGDPEQTGLTARLCSRSVSTPVPSHSPKTLQLDHSYDCECQLFSFFHKGGPTMVGQTVCTLHLLTLTQQNTKVWCHIFFII